MTDSNKHTPDPPIEPILTRTPPRSPYERWTQEKNERSLKGQLAVQAEPKAKLKPQPRKSNLEIEAHRPVESVDLLSPYPTDREIEIGYRKLLYSARNLRQGEDSPLEIEDARVAEYVRRTVATVPDEMAEFAQDYDKRFQVEELARTFVPYLRENRSEPEPDRDSIAERLLSRARARFGDSASPRQFLEELVYPRYSLHRWLDNLIRYERGKGKPSNSEVDIPSTNESSEGERSEDRTGGVSADSEENCEAEDAVKAKFERVDKNFVIEYIDKRATITTTQGAIMIHHMLREMGEPVTAEVLYDLLGGLPNAPLTKESVVSANENLQVSSMPNASIQPDWDRLKKMKNEYKNRLAEIEEEIPLKQGGGDIPGVERLESEKSSILKKFNKDGNLRPEKRTDTQAIKNRVAVAIGKAREKIEKQIPNLGIHLNSFLKSEGGIWTYLPEEKIDWKA